MSELKRIQHLIETHKVDGIATRVKHDPVMLAAVNCHALKGCGFLLHRAG